MFSNIDTAKKDGTSVRDKVLNDLVENKTPTSVITRNGSHLTGVITEYDSVCMLLTKREASGQYGGTYCIYHDAVSTFGAASL